MAAADDTTLQSQLEQVFFDPTKAIDTNVHGAVPKPLARAKSIIFRDEMLRGKQFPDVYRDTRWDEGAARLAMALIFDYDKENGKASAIADIILQLSNQQARWQSHLRNTGCGMGSSGR